MNNSPPALQTYFNALPQAHREETEEFRGMINRHLPTGFAEIAELRQISWVVPLSVYPSGYAAAKNQPLPFISLARRKNHIALYHMGIYAYPGLMEWFVQQYQAECGQLPDMGKGCIRFKQMEGIPKNTLTTLFEKIDIADWVSFYESQRKKK